jgi:hypothetical protein
LRPATAARLLLAAAAVALGVAPAAAQATGVIVVRPDTLLHLAGTDMYCNVLKEGAVSGVACAHYPDAPRSSVPRGYSLVATEKGVVVEPPGGSTPVYGDVEPPLASEPVLAGGSAHPAPLTLGVNELAAIGGTHMAVIVTPAVGGGTAIGVVYLDRSYHPVPRTYTIGISDHFVTIAEVTGGKTTKVVYRHAVY